MRPPSPFARDLITLVVGQLWFLDTCADEVVDPDGEVVDFDDAVRQMEWISHVLDQQSEEDRGTILAVVADLAAKEQDPDYRRFLESFGELSGLIPTED